MAKQTEIHLSRRERQIMDIIYRRGPASVTQVLEDMPDAPSYSAVRAFLRILEEKGHLKHTKEGPRYVYQPARSRSSAAHSAMKRVLRTFFDGSSEKAVAALLQVSDSKLSEGELERLAGLIEKAGKQGG